MSQIGLTAHATKAAQVVTDVASIADAARL